MGWPRSKGPEAERVGVLNWLGGSTAGQDEEDAKNDSSPAIFSLCRRSPGLGIRVHMMFSGVCSVSGDVPTAIQKIQEKEERY